MIFEQLKDMLGPFKDIFGRFLPKAPAPGKANFNELMKEPKSLVFASIMKLFEATSAKNPNQAVANLMPKVMLGVLAGFFGMFLPKRSKAFQGIMKFARPFLGNFFKPEAAAAPAPDASAAAAAAAGAQPARPAPDAPEAADLPEFGAALSRAARSFLPGFGAAAAAARAAFGGSQPQPAARAENGAGSSFRNRR